MLPFIADKKEVSPWRGKQILQSGHKLHTHTHTKSHTHMLPLPSHPPPPKKKKKKKDSLKSQAHLTRAVTSPLSSSQGGGGGYLGGGQYLVPLMKQLPLVLCVTGMCMLNIPLQQRLHYQNSAKISTIARSR